MNDNQTTVIIIQSNQSTSEIEKLTDVGKQLTKLMYSATDFKKALSDKVVIVMIPERPTLDTNTKCKGRLARGEDCNCSYHMSQHLDSLHNSIQHIVRHGIKHGINIQIKHKYPNKVI
jgi:hypothetical protein